MERHTWKKRLALAVAGGYLLMSATAALAAPVELTLDEAIALALKNNPTVRIAEADRENAAWVLREKQAGMGPTLSYTHSDTRISPAAGSTSPDIRNNFDNKIGLSLSLYSGGKLDGLVGQAKIGQQVADLGVAKTKQQLKLDATAAYFSVLQTRNLLQVAQESVDNLAAHLKNVQAQYEVGTVAKSDVLRSEVELANAQQKLIIAQNNYDLAVARLNNVIGLPLDGEVKLKEELKYGKFSQALDESIKYALQRRPEVVQADAGVASAREGVKVARSGYLPSVSLSGTKDWNDTEFPGTQNHNWSLNVTASLALFDSQLTRSKVKESETGVTKAAEQARQTKDSVALEVRQEFLNVKEAEKRIDTSQVAVAKAEEDFKIAQVRYNAGVGTNLDVIDAQLALAQAKTNYIQALYDFNTSKAKLDRAMGVAVQ